MRKKISYHFLWIPLFLGLFSYAHWVEPRWIEVSYHRFREEKKKSIRIAHVSDLHIRSIGGREANLLAILEREKPDAILISGDSVDENANYRAVGDFLREMRAPLGIWLVKGNWEHWRPNEKEKELYFAAGVRFLDNSAEKLAEDVWVVGVDDESAGSPDLKKAFKGVPKDALTIGLFHSPAFFDHSSQYFNLALAGHTHGGQVRLPFLPPFWQPEGSGGYVAGWYKVGDSKMYVSRGLGTSILDIRFFCRPELPIVEIGI
jgi:uncharacterized protein